MSISTCNKFRKTPGQFHNFNTEQLELDQLVSDQADNHPEYSHSSQNPDNFFFELMVSKEPNHS